MSDLRRRKQENGGRTFASHQVKVSETEEKLLQGKANAAGISVSRLLVESALGSTPIINSKVFLNELFGIRRELWKLNEKQALPDDVREANAKLADLIGDLL
jgi:hypothetical protein